MVYLVHCTDQHPRMVTEIHAITPKLIRYRLGCGSDSSDHYEHEISAVKDQVKALTTKDTTE